MPVEVLTPREVPLGGLRSMTVRRTLPQRQRSLIGAWCFLDHYGPDDVLESGGMLVPPHPHIGLQTVSWLFSGMVEHRDSLGTRAFVRPGQLNLMTAGRGISHSEVSTDDTRILHGAQLWVALPDGAREIAPAFDHYAPPRVTGDGWEARVFLGSWLGQTSPVRTWTPLLGAEVALDSGSRLDADPPQDHELGVLVDRGTVTVNGEEVAAHELAFVPPGEGLVVEALDDTRVLVIGGPPFGEEVVMWWNFVGRSHEEVVEARGDWQAQLADGVDHVVHGRFGLVGGGLPAIPAPPLPGVRLKPRR